MDEDDRKELEAVRHALAGLAGGSLDGDALLDAAIKQASYDVQESRIEQCANCGELYHADYGGEYIDPFDCVDLRRELRIRSMKKLHHKHFCDFLCLREYAYARYLPY